MPEEHVPPWSQRDDRFNVTNADNEYLLAWGNQRVVIEWVDEVNGRGAEEFPGFVPTRHELMQLAKYWARVALEIRWLWFLGWQSGSTESRLRSFADRRIARVASVLGEIEVQQAIDEVYDGFGKEQDEELRDIFLNGSDEDWNTVRNKLQREPDPYQESL